MPEAAFHFTCPKCGESFTDDVPYQDVARGHAWESRDANVCRYVACDDPACRALKHPTTLEEYSEALVHWRDHRLDGGCSHGC